MGGTASEETKKVILEIRNDSVVKEFPQQTVINLIPTTLKESSVSKTGSVKLGVEENSKSDAFSEMKIGLVTTENPVTGSAEGSSSTGGIEAIYV